MGLIDKVRTMIHEQDEYEEEYGGYEGDVGLEGPAPVQTTNTFTPGKPAYGGYDTMAQQPSKLRIISIEPTQFEDGDKIVEHMNAQRPVIINFENTDIKVASRIVDFLSGATFAVKGKLKKISQQIYMVLPVSATLEGVEGLEVAATGQATPVTPTWHHDNNM